MKIRFLILLTLYFRVISYAQDMEPLTASSLGFEVKTFNEGTAFTAIALDSINKRVWGGTDQKGVYNLNLNLDDLPENFSSFNSSGSGPDLSQIKIKDMATDGSGNVWIAHQGVNFNGGQGGMEKIGSDLSTQHYSPDRNALGFQFFERDGLSGLRLSSVTVDKNNRVWSTSRNHNLTSGSTFILTPGDISYKDVSSNKFRTKAAWFDASGSISIKPAELPYPANTFNPGPTDNPENRNMQAISTDSTKVLVGSWAYTVKDSKERLPNRVLKYDLNGVFEAQYTFEEMNFPAGGIINGIYANNSKGIWVTTSFTNKGFSVFEEQKNENGEVVPEKWTYMDPASESVKRILPPDTRFNDNAIWGNAYGNVFMGTNNGLLVYDGRGSASSISSYTFYTSEIFLDASFNPYAVVNPNMISTNILGGVSQDEGIQWMATDNGIMRMKIGFVSTGEYKNVNGEMLFSTDPKSCGIEDVDFIVDKIQERYDGDLSDATWHEFTLTTIVCDPTFDNRPYCTVENVFEMMKKNIRYQYPIPINFPEDLTNPPFLDLFDKQKLEDFETVVDLQTEKIDGVESILLEGTSFFGPEFTKKLFEEGYQVRGIKLFNDVEDFFQDVEDFLGKFIDEDALIESGGRLGQALSGGFEFGDALFLAPSSSGSGEIDIFIVPKDDIEPTPVPENSTAQGVFELQMELSGMEGVNCKRYTLYNPPQFYDNRSLFIRNFDQIKGLQGCTTNLGDDQSDDIFLFIDDKKYKMQNYTAEGHALHPGRVTRWVERDESGQIVIKTHGEGFHFCNNPTSLGELMGSFGEAAGKANTINGTIIFKNNDIDLATDFRKLNNPNEN